MPNNTGTVPPDSHFLHGPATSEIDVRLRLYTARRKMSQDTDPVGAMLLSIEISKLWIGKLAEENNAIRDRLNRRAFTELGIDYAP